MKAQLKKYFPSTFLWARRVKDQALVEIRTIKTVGLINLVRSIASFRAKNLSELPVQKIKSITVQGVSFESAEQLKGLLGEHEAGAHSYYLCPTKWSESLLAPIQKNYPPGCGLKIRKGSGDQDSKGFTNDSSGRVQKYLAESHKGQLLVANYLSAVGISPRLYDVFEISGNGCVCVAYVVEHIPNENTDCSKCSMVVDYLKNITLQGKLTLVNWNGFDDTDFKCPNCNGNLLRATDGDPKYVDTQNFSMGNNFHQHLADVAEASRNVSHFGDQSRLFGGKYLYQRIPGLNLPAKRDPALRADVLDGMLESAGLSIEGAIIIDVGCNLGLMGAQYLKRKSHWVHGIDMPAVVENAHAISLSIGLTRFSYHGCLITKEINLLSDAPQFYQEERLPLWISYLAIRGHVGWVDHLSSLDWDYMLYEGHEFDDENSTRRHLAELNEMANIEVLEKRSVRDGTSESRFFALIARVK